MLGSMLDVIPWLCRCRCAEMMVEVCKDSYASERDLILARGVLRSACNALSVCVPVCLCLGLCRGDVCTCACMHACVCVCIYARVCGGGLTSKMT